MDLLASQEPRRPRRRPPTIIIIDRRILVQSCVLRLLKQELSRFHACGARNTSDLSHAVGQDVRLIAVAIESRPLTDPSVKLDVIATAEMFPQASIVVISDCEDDVTAQDALQWGVRGFFPSSLPIEVAVAGFRVVLAGGVYCPPPAVAGSKSAMRLLHLTRSRSEGEPNRAGPGARCDRNDTGSVRLTPRETVVISELQLGHSNKVIAAKLGMSENTVKMHIQHLMRKLGARTRTEAVFRWARSRALAHPLERVGSM